MQIEPVPPPINRQLAAKISDRAQSPVEGFARGITVNVVSPGPTDTDLFSIGESEQDKQRFGQLAAFGRLGQPVDVAGAVALLATDDAHWITGQNIRANGGTV
jgi:3-oxoacyl-[acyl-carrier protein] reductase